MLALNRSLLRGEDADVAAVLALVLKQHDAIYEREQRVILAAAHIEARFVACAALANQDRTRVDQLAAEAFHAQPLPLRVTAVYGRAAAFLMCHEDILLGSWLELDATDFNRSIILPVAARDFVLAAGLKFEDRNFRMTPLRGDLANDLRFRGIGSGQKSLLVGAHGQHVFKRDLPAHFAGKSFNL